MASKIDILRKEGHQFCVENHFFYLHNNNNNVCRH